MPEPARIASVRWSHDGRRFAFTRFSEESVELWVAEAAQGEAERVVSGVNTVLGSGFGWMPDGEDLWCLVFPSGHGDAPERPAVPGGPAVQETSGNRSPLRTYTNLLKSPYDEELFTHYVTAQLALVDTTSGDVSNVGRADLLKRVQPSPDGRHFLVQRLKRPFSYLLPSGQLCPFDRSLELGRQARTPRGRGSAGREHPHRRRTHRAPQRAMEGDR